MVQATAEQWPGFVLHLDEPHPLCTYADYVRTLWAGLGDLVIVEGDSIPPPGSLAGLLECPAPWCTHQSWVGERYLEDTLGLARFSAALQRFRPYLADEALSKPIFWGDRHNRGLAEFRPAKELGVVPLEDAALEVWPELAERTRRRQHHPPTTAHPKAIDMRLGGELRKLGLTPHVHRPPALHLRYANDPGRDARWPGTLLADPVRPG